MLLLLLEEEEGGGGGEGEEEQQQQQRSSSSSRRRLIFPEIQHDTHTHTHTHTLTHTHTHSLSLSHTQGDEGSGRAGGRMHVGADEIAQQEVRRKRVVAGEIAGEIAQPEVPRGIPNRSDTESRLDDMRGLLPFAFFLVF